MAPRQEGRFRPAAPAFCCADWEMPSSPATLRRTRCRLRWITTAADARSRRGQTELAPTPPHDHRSQGRRHPKPAPGHRSEYQRDRDRIIHSGAFPPARVQDPGLRQSRGRPVPHAADAFDRSCADRAHHGPRTCSSTKNCAEAVSLAHDLGHTPFGHAGQEALNDCMKPYGGFEHNAQSLRVVDELEDKYAEFRGLNLMFDTREGILKHCSVATRAHAGRRSANVSSTRRSRALKPSSPIAPTRSPTTTMTSTTACALAC